MRDPPSGVYIRSRRWGAERRVMRAQTRERGPPLAGVEICYFCQAQFQLSIAVAIELSLALISLHNHPPAHPPTC